MKTNKLTIEQCQIFASVIAQEKQTQEYVDNIIKQINKFNVFCTTDQLTSLKYCTEKVQILDEIINHLNKDLLYDGLIRFCTAQQITPYTMIVLYRIHKLEIKNLTFILAASQYITQPQIVKEYVKLLYIVIQNEDFNDEFIKCNIPTCCYLNSQLFKYYDSINSQDYKLLIIKIIVEILQFYMKGEIIKYEAQIYSMIIQLLSNVKTNNLIEMQFTIPYNCQLLDDKEQFILNTNKIEYATQLFKILIQTDDKSVFQHEPEIKMIDYTQLINQMLKIIYQIYDEKTDKDTIKKIVELQQLIVQYDQNTVKQYEGNLLKSEKMTLLKFYIILLQQNVDNKEYLQKTIQSAIQYINYINSVYFKLYSVQNQTPNQINSQQIQKVLERGDILAQNFNIMLFLLQNKSLKENLTQDQELSLLNQLVTISTVFGDQDNNMVNLIQNLLQNNQKYNNQVIITCLKLYKEKIIYQNSQACLKKKILIDNNILTIINNLISTQSQDIITQILIDHNIKFSEFIGNLLIAFALNSDVQNIIKTIQLTQHSYESKDMIQEIQQIDNLSQVKLQKIFNSDFQDLYLKQQYSKPIILSQQPLEQTTKNLWTTIYNCINLLTCQEQQQIYNSLVYFTTQFSVQKIYQQNIQMLKVILISNICLNQNIPIIIDNIQNFQQWLQDQVYDLLEDSFKYDTIYFTCQMLSSADTQIVYNCLQNMSLESNFEVRYNIFLRSLHYCNIKQLIESTKQSVQQKVLIQRIYNELQQYKDCKFLSINKARIQFLQLVKYVQLYTNLSQQFISQMIETVAMQFIDCDILQTETGHCQLTFEAVETQYEVQCDGNNVQICSDHSNIIKTYSQFVNMLLSISKYIKVSEKVFNATAVQLLVVIYTSQQQSIDSILVEVLCKYFEQLCYRSIMSSLTIKQLIYCLDLYESIYPKIHITYRHVFTESLERLLFKLSENYQVRDNIFTQTNNLLFKLLVCGSEKVILLANKLFTNKDMTIIDIINQFNYLQIRYAIDYIYKNYSLQFEWCDFVLQKLLDSKLMTEELKEEIVESLLQIQLINISKEEHIIKRIISLIDVQMVQRITQLLYQSKNLMNSVQISRILIQNNTPIAVKIVEQMYIQLQEDYDAETVYKIATIIINMFMFNTTGELMDAQSLTFVTSLCYLETYYYNQRMHQQLTELITSVMKQQQIEYNENDQLLLLIIKVNQELFKKYNCKPIDQIKALKAYQEILQYYYSYFNLMFNKDFQDLCQRIQDIDQQILQNEFIAQLLVILYSNNLVQDFQTKLEKQLILILQSQYTTKQFIEQFINNYDFGILNEEEKEQILQFIIHNYPIQDDKQELIKCLINNKKDQEQIKQNIFYIIQILGNDCKEYLIKLFQCKEDDLIICIANITTIKKQLLSFTFINIQEQGQQIVISLITKLLKDEILDKDEVILQLLKESDIQIIKQIMMI